MIDDADRPIAIAGNEQHPLVVAVRPEPAQGRLNAWTYSTIGGGSLVLGGVVAAWAVDLVPGDRVWRTAPDRASWFARAGLFHHQSFTAT